jgi:hypothetical protein
MWVIKFALCRHVYHDWCVVYHFGTSIKCIQQGCEEEMHKSWWILASLKKLNLSIPIEDEGKNMTTKGQQLQACSHKGATLTFSFIISFFIVVWRQVVLFK